jgi:hypothetical protein
VTALPNGRPRRQWCRVSLAHPCPICNKPDWCAVTADGAMVRCQRVEQGAFKTGTDKAGVVYYLHRQNGDGPRPAAALPPRASGATAQRADPDTLHSVYDALLGHLALSKPHRDNLQKRGLPDSEIDRRLYRTLPVQGRARVARALHDRFGDALLSVPGFVLKQNKDGRYYPTIAGSTGLRNNVSAPPSDSTASRRSSGSGGGGGSPAVASVRAAAT